MVPDRQKVRTDGRTHGRRQNYIPPTSSGDNNKGADQSAQMHRLVCDFVVLKTLKTGFLVSGPI